MNKHGKIINGELIAGIPRTYKCSTGKTISNYHLQDSDRWISDGFKPIEKIFPEITDKQKYGIPSFKVLDSKIVVTATIVNRPVEIIVDYKTDIEELKRQVRSLQEQINRMNN